MKIASLVIAAAVAGGGLLLSPIDVGDDHTALMPALGVAPAEASRRGQVRRTARRTARRTSRRTTRRLNTLPGGCARRSGYYYCGGVYYQPIVENGSTVYVVVNP
jgi:hypothetical protein